LGTHITTPFSIHHTRHTYYRAVSHSFRLDFDTALLTSLPSALQKDPASRGTFDNVVVTNVEDELQKRPEGAPRVFFLNSGAAAMTFDCGKQSPSRRLVKLKETLAEAAPAREERASKVGCVPAGDTSKKTKGRRV